MNESPQPRWELLPDPGSLAPGNRGPFALQPPTVRELLADEQRRWLATRDDEGIIDLMVQHGTAVEWHATLSTFFDGLVTGSGVAAGVDCLCGFLRHVRIPPLGVTARGQSGGAWRQAILLGECLRILAARQAALPDDLVSALRRAALQGIVQEIALPDRHALAVALGRLGDPRVAEDLRVASHPADHPGYVPVPEGCYPVGDRDREAVLAQPCWLSKYPVTNAQYRLFLEDGGYQRQDLWSDAGWQWLLWEGAAAPEEWHNAGFNAPTQPVVSVSWWEAEAFCRWAGGRLPSADESEAAARGFGGWVYPWGDEWEQDACNSEERLKRPSAVGICPRDCAACGAMDVAGNVSEWCSDVVGSFRVFRGGSWCDAPASCRSAYRLRHWPQYRLNEVGFRVARNDPR